jgi:hypothetical protein
VNKRAGTPNIVRRMLIQKECLPANSLAQPALLLPKLETRNSQKVFYFGGNHSKSPTGITGSRHFYGCI